MSEALDHFSDVAAGYAKYRPLYPKELYDFLLTLVVTRQTAWDAGTGNGQVASVLAKSFSHVIATDISANQIDHASQFPNIEYAVRPAEDSGIPDKTIDLVAVAQAAHWFDMEAFASEVNRVCKNDSILAIWGYTLFQSTPMVDAHVRQLYANVLDGYWDPHRDLVDRRYQDFHLPFQELPCPNFEMLNTWNADTILGYLGTWSAVNAYRKANHTNPIETIRQDIKDALGESSVICHTPVFLRAWRI